MVSIPGAQFRHTLDIEQLQVFHQGVERISAAIDNLAVELKRYNDAGETVEIMSDESDIPIRRYQTNHDAEHEAEYEAWLRDGRPNLEDWLKARKTGFKDLPPVPGRIGDGDIDYITVGSEKTRLSSTPRNGMRCIEHGTVNCELGHP